MTTKCLSCGHLHYDIQLNCSKCGSFYTKIIIDEEPEKIESKAHVVMDKIKHTLEQLIPHGTKND